MDIKSIVSKPFNELTLTELTFLMSLGCGLCQYEQDDCLREGANCALGVYKRQKTKLAFGNYQGT